MDRLYDASAFFNLFARTDQYGHFLGQAVLDLTQYELGNALSKKCTDDNRDATLKLFDEYVGVIAHMRVLGMGGMQRDVLATASSTGLTFYDSAYVAAAERHGLVLVTDDAEMSEAARRRGISTITSAEV